MSVEGGIGGGVVWWGRSREEVGDQEEWGGMGAGLERREREASSCKDVLYTR